MWRDPGRRRIRSWDLARMQYASVVSERDQLKHELAQTQQELASARQSVHDLRGVIDEMLATRRACEMAVNQ